jgi:hypothetical protein
MMETMETHELNGHNGKIWNYKNRDGYCRVSPDSLDISFSDFRILLSSPHTVYSSISIPYKKLARSS